MSSQECFQFRENGSCPYGTNCRFIHPNQQTRGSTRKATQVCYTFRDTGACQYGDDCRFSHDLSLKEAAAGSAAAGGGARPSQEQKERKPPRERKPREPRENRPPVNVPDGAGRLECYTFKETGTCPYGANCRYIHTGEDTRGSKRRDAQVCYTFRETGACQYGDECRYSHKKEDMANAGAGNNNGNNNSAPRKPGGAGKRNGADGPKKVCRDFAASGSCKYGDNCRFSHDPKDEQD